jgi:hypothetical protein
MTAEESVVATAVFAWKQNLKGAEQLFGRLDDQQLLTEVAPGKNRLIYLWGHLIAVHDAMLPLLGLGERVHPELAAIFLTGADKTVAVLPSGTELQSLWDEVNDRLLAGISSFTVADWVQKHSAVSDEDFIANPLRNRLAILLSRTSHVSYHLGQGRLAPT